MKTILLALLLAMAGSELMAQMPTLPGPSVPPVNPQRRVPRYPNSKLPPGFAPGAGQTTRPRRWPSRKRRFHPA